mmetsp:Transcript_26650/g.62595  ORF Transcript_26650/g.62595 Transcript_26650/m.62595 type:complete len:353 (-) Transcript_26650:77-1135(-)
MERRQDRRGRRGRSIPRRERFVLPIPEIRTSQRRRRAVPIADPQNPQRRNRAGRPHRNGNQVPVRMPDAIQPPRREPPAADHQKDLLEGSRGGTPLVHLGEHQRQRPQGEKHPDLGRKRFQGVPREPRPWTPGGGRSRSRLRIPVAALRRRVQGHAHRLLRPGRRPAGEVHRLDQEQPGGSPDPHERLEPVGPRRDGAPALPPAVPVLRRYHQERGQLPDVPAVGRHGPGRSVQHRQLRPADPPGSPRHGSQAGGPRPHAGRRPRVPQPHRAAPGAARAESPGVSQDFHRRPRRVQNDRRLRLRGPARCGVPPAREDLHENGRVEAGGGDERTKPPGRASRWARRREAGERL